MIPPPPRHINQFLPFRLSIFPILLRRDLTRMILVSLVCTTDVRELPPGYYRVEGVSEEVQDLVELAVVVEGIWCEDFWQRWEMSLWVVE